MNRPIFSGHESFHCKTYWLKRGYDFIKQGGSFNDSNAVISLGVGKNMVSSIKYWMKSFEILDENNKLTELADLLLDTENGYDPYFENVGTLWLLHFHLVNADIATLYNKTFIGYHRQRNIIDKDKLLFYIQHTCYDALGNISQFNAKTVQKDITVLIHNYCHKNGGNIEDMNSLLGPLNLIREANDDTYEFNYNMSERVPDEIFFYAVTKRLQENVSNNSKSISFDSILETASIFCLTNNDTLKIIKRLCEKYKDSMVFSDIAGIKELQFKKEVGTVQILKDYYLDK